MSSLAIASAIDAGVDASSASPATTSVGATARHDAAPVLSVRGLVKRYGGLVVTQDVDLDLRHGEVHAIVGPNGAGKTTLLGQLTGDVRPDAGRIFFGPRDITSMPVHRRARLGIGRSFQITSVFPDLTVIENALLAVQAHDGHAFRFWRRALDDARSHGPERWRCSSAWVSPTRPSASPDR